MNLLFDFLLGTPQGANPAFVLADGQEWSRADLLARTGQYANALAASGVGIGDRVTAQINKSADAIAVYLAVIRMGAVFMPLNTAYAPGELSYFLSDAEPAVFLCDPKGAGAELALPPGVRRLTLDGSGKGTLADLANAQPSAFDTVARQGDDLAALVYTSGTTGRSKGAMLSHENLTSNARTLIEAWRITAADRLIHILPIFHTHGLFVACNSVLAAGGTILIHAGFDTAAIIADFARATILMGVPTHYTRLLQDNALSRDSTRDMRLFISGSAPLLAESHQAFERATGQAILERYGMTECGMALSNPYDGERRPGTVGAPLPGVSARIVSGPDNHPVAAGEVGILELHGPNVFQGYWRQPEKTAETFRDGWLVTGDLARQSEDGYFELVGRDKDLVITGGLNVYPKEVEALIDAIPGVLESAVIGLPHPDFGEGVTAVVVLEPGSGVSAETIVAALTDELARFKQPKRVLFLDELPRNAMGKVQKAELRKANAGLYLDASAPVTAAVSAPAAPRQ